MGRNGRVQGAATSALARAIREAQGSLDVSTAELSRRSGIPESTLRKLRRGDISIDYEQMRSIAQALRVSIATIAARAEEIEASEQ